MEQSSGGSANSSDFVRKLYKMLENPSDESVVRWGNEGDSFVVLENEKFTKHILPKHFKHSNFASFVRQLNKYDFHKVRHSNEDGGGSPYGPGAWEFKHPDFKMNNKDALDNIRRKAPAARKPAAPADDMLVPTHQIDMLNSQVVATQQQVTALQERNTELNMQNNTLVQELVQLKGFVFNHEQILGYLVNAIMGDYDARRRRQSRSLFPGSSADVAGHAVLATAADQLQPILEDETPPSPLLHASKLLSETNVDMLMNNRNLEHTNGLLTSPTPDLANGRASTGSAPPSAGSSGTLRFADLDGLVYPVGQTNGIDPMYGDHIHNIPYSLPASKAPEAAPIGGVPATARKQNLPDPGWIRTPQILLVEDDPMCRKIGQKFLSAFHCTITTAHDGIQAVEKVRSGMNFDLILMDIIMPNLDGVSACHLIRQSNEIPTVAMTSNIRSDDINLYYQHGMSDILPKPFTKEGLLQLLEKHLNHLKKHPNPTLEQIKDEDSHLQHHAHLQMHSPQKPHHPSSTSTWTASNSPQTPVTHQPPPSDTSDHSQHYASLYANSQSQQPPQQQQTGQLVGPNGLAYVTPPGVGPQIVGQRRPLDLGDADLGGGGKRQQTTMYGPPPGLQGMRSR